MTPKEKAKELFEKMYNISDELNKYPMCFDTAKACALVCVNELYIDNKKENDFVGMTYWQEVKKEIENYEI